jgi:hypothetical protein
LHKINQDTTEHCKDIVDGKEDENNRPFEPVIVENLKTATINKNILKGALKIKVTK